MAKWPTTIPRRVREALGLRVGDEVEFVPTEGGWLVRRRRPAGLFERYVGYLRNLAGQDPDDLLRELRGL